MKDKTLLIKNLLDEITRLPDFLQRIAEELSLAHETVASLNLALEEAMVNSIQYAYPSPGEGEISLDAHWDASTGNLQFTLTDSGTPFDPTTIPEADITLSVEERPIGGLGIFLIRQIMDEVSYRYEEERNVLVMTKNITGK